MLIALKLFAICYVLLGILFATKPASLRGYVGFWKEKKHLYLGAVIAALFGIFLLLTASQCDWPTFIAALGVLALLKCTLIFVLGPDKLMPILQWYEKQPDMALRVIGGLAVVIGVFIFLAV